jgi:hypothetical protein
MARKQEYHSYLLRLWRAGAGPAATWRASLQEIPAGTRRAFTSLEDLLAYLREQVSTDGPPDEEAGDAEAPPEGAAPADEEGS